LIKQLKAGLHRKLTLVSAPAGFGKTTLLSEWAQALVGATPSGAATRVIAPAVAIAWLSLDEGDHDAACFLAYLTAALQTTWPGIGKGALSVLQSPQPPPIEAVLTALINEIAALPGRTVLVLDDYHVIESQPIDKALVFLLDHLPSQMHLVVATRSDPSLPLSRLRAGGQMTEIRADDLRFTLQEAAAFLDRAMGLDMSAENVAALEARTEGWIAGLQLAALALQGTLSMKRLKQDSDVTDFVNRFAGSDRYIQDYLTDEVLRQRPKGTKDFLLRTSVLDRLSAPLCDAVLFGYTRTPSSSEATAVRSGYTQTPSKPEGTAVTQQKNSQAILEALDAANLFVIPLDNERRWYRYHHLFADLLRQRLHVQQPGSVDELHIRASAWYEDKGLAIDAFRHAAAANDIDRAERLIEGEGVPLQYRGAATTLLKWLASLPTTVLDARPSLWVTYASASNLAGQPAGAEQRLRAAEAALAGLGSLQGAEPDPKTRDLVGHIAAIRAMMAVGQHQQEAILAQSLRALDYLHPDNLPVRTIATWTLGYAYQLQGNRAAASQAYADVLSISGESGDVVSALAASTGLGNLQESANQLFLAAESYRHGMELFGDPPQPIAVGSYLGLARILYEWNELDAAEQQGQLSLQLGRQLESIDTFALCALLLARLKLAQGDVAQAAALSDQADRYVRERNFMHRMPEITAAQVRQLLHLGDLAAAADLAEKHELPISQARVHLAQGKPAAALAILDPLRQQAEASGLEDRRLKVMVLQAVALDAHGEKSEALQLLREALALAEPGGFVRTFVDEGPPMAQLLSELADLGVMPDYTGKLLAAFEDATKEDRSPVVDRPSSPLVEPLTQRELEVLQHIAQGLSNREIGERLFIALDTVKGHNRRIYGKLQVRRRSEAVSRGRELGLL
jgi:LuxR family maltose regulon positive regulatory protein